MAAKSKRKSEERSFEINEFIPFACHYSPETILTKNNELIQFIKLDFDAGYDDNDFREELRSAINSAIDPAKHAIWIHTTRSREEEKKLTAGDFRKNIELRWRKRLPSKVHYDNCIYISILHDSKSAALINPKNYFRALNYRAETAFKNQHLSKIHSELNTTVDKIGGALRKFGAKKLSIYEEGGVYYSEPMEFMHRILSFYDDHIPVPVGDLSKFLIPENLSFNIYSGQMDLMSERGTHYGAVITLKECERLIAKSLDNLLNIDCELVISQSLEFGTANMMLPPLEYQKEVQKISQDKDFFELTGIDKIESTDPDNFAVQQTNILVMQDSRAKLQSKLIEIHEELSKLGIIAITEDLRLERTFWSMLPGNFAFLKRQDIVPRKDIANFAILGNDIYQDCDNSMFGNPIIFFEDAEKEPYPFHIINNGSSNLLSIAEEEERRVSLINLLVLHASRYPARIVYYDPTGKYQNFAKSVGVEYTTSPDFDKFKASMGETPSIIAFTSLEKILSGSNSSDFFNNFLDYAGENNSVVIAGIDANENAIKLLPSFDSQAFFGMPNARKMVENYDLFDDEVKILHLLEDKKIYLKHNYEEKILQFSPTEPMIKSLLSGEKI